MGVSDVNEYKRQIVITRESIEEDLKDYINANKEEAAIGSSKQGKKLVFVRPKINRKNT